MLLKEYYISLLLLFVSSVCWSQNNPPKIVAVGNQAYCPLSQINIVTNFDIIDVDDTEIDAFYIQISTGYIRGQDILILTNNHPNIVSQWNSLEGKLTLKGSGSGLVSYVDIIAAVKDVVFENNKLTVSGEKYFSFTIGDANYLPSTGHYYEYVPDIGITWTDAKAAAELRTYFGLQGYLATITSTEEAQLTGEQAAGAGWIGGNDTETEGVWKWVTGPENGTIFWNGLANGSSPNFAFWNTNEPNDLSGEDYAHVTAPNVGVPGSWNDLSNTGAVSGDYQPKGYIVEYGGTTGDPDLDLSASTSIYVPVINSTLSSVNCGPGTVTLLATASSGLVLWFDSALGETIIHTGNTFTTPVLETSTTYYVLASENGCTEGERLIVTATINKIPVIEPEVILKNCDEDGNPDGFTDFNLNEASEIITLGDNSLIVTFYLALADAETGLNSINPSPFNNATSNIVYARIETTSGCYKTATVNLQVSTTSFPPNFIEQLESCDLDQTNDGVYSFDLTQASENILNQLPIQNLRVQYYRNLLDAQLEQNEILPQTDYRNETPYSQTLFVRVESNDNGDCFGIGPYLTLTVNPLPEFEILSPTAIVCLNLPPITLETYNPSDNYTYIWTDDKNNIVSTQSTATIFSSGQYTVVATSSLNCESYPKTVTVSESIIADIKIDDITIIDNSENNSIEVNDENGNLGIGDYEFSLDNSFGPYQDETLFEYVTPGLHTVYIKDKNNCGIAQMDVSVIGYPKFFTPNGDGINDTWQVDGVSSQPNSNIYIYDKFGKLLIKIGAKERGWDGFYNGKLLPSSDYWYMVQLDDGRIHKGHFSLIRR